MKTENVDLGLIGLFSLVGLPYALKFLWSPIMDRFIPPFLGRRRGWILISQIALIASISAMAFCSPARFPGITALLAFGVAFFSASQDIVVDAYRTDVLSNDEIGPGASLYIAGYRVAMLVSGSVALILSDHLSWRAVYLIMAGTMVIGFITSLFAPEPEAPTETPRNLADAVVLPFVEFFKRVGALETLAFVLFYKIDMILASAMMTPFMLDIGFTKTDIGAVTKGIGLAATLIGTVVGGAGMVRFGMRKSLWIFGLTQGIANLSFTWLAHVGHHYPMMVAAITAESLFSGMGTAAFTAFMMSICDKRYSATQYALITSLMALSRVLGGAPSGYLAQALGWEHYFLFCTFAMIPGLVILARYSSWESSEVFSTAQ